MKRGFVKLTHFIFDQKLSGLSNFLSKILWFPPLQFEYFLFYSLLCDKLNVLWTNLDIWLGHLGLWEALVNNFHRFLTFYRPTANYLMENTIIKLTDSESLLVAALLPCICQIYPFHGQVKFYKTHFPPNWKIQRNVKAFVLVKDGEEALLDNAPVLSPVRRRITPDSTSKNTSIKFKTQQKGMHFFFWVGFEKPLLAVKTTWLVFVDHSHLNWL